MEDFRLKVFVSAAKNLSFTKAAEETFISQLAVTKHIRELEERYRTRLFERNGNRLTLTPAGNRLLSLAEDIVERYRMMDYEMHLLNGLYKGELRLGASTTIAQYVLPSYLAKFHSRYRDIRLTLINGNSAVIEQALLRQNIDLGFVEGQSRQAGLKYTPFMRDELVAVVAAGSSMASADEIGLDMLREIPLVLRENGSGTLDVIREALAERGLAADSLNVQMQLGSTESIKRYLENADAMGIVSIRSVDRELKAGTLKVIEIPELSMPRQFAYVQRPGKESPLVELFLNYSSFGTGTDTI